MDLVESFQKKNRLFLQAELNDYGKIVGQLDIILNDETAKFGIWQPSVLLEYRDTGVGSALVNHAFKLLKTRGVKRVFATLKYSNPSEAEWHKSLFSEVGLTSTTHEGVQLLVNLSELGDLPSPTFSGEITTSADFSLEEISELIVESFGASPEDQEIHRGWSMDDYETVLTIHQRIRDGAMGNSPADLWKLAIVDGKLAGLIIGFIRESKFRAISGFIGELGVSPEFRKQGVAYALVRSLQDSFKEYGCVYSKVATPHTNVNGLSTYNKAGYREVNRVVSYEKDL